MFELVILTIFTTPPKKKYYMTKTYIFDMMKHENLIIEKGANYECCGSTIIDWLNGKRV